MDSLFRAYRTYRQTDDGYELDGYLVREFIDGYQINHAVVSVSEALALDRCLQKFERMLSRTGALDLGFSEQTPSAAALARYPLPELPEGHATVIAALRDRIAQRAQIRDEDCLNHLVELRTRTAARQAAIQNAVDLDGYK